MCKSRRNPEKESPRTNMTNSMSSHTRTSRFSRLNHIDPSTNIWKTYFPAFFASRTSTVIHLFRVKEVVAVSQNVFVHAPSPIALRNKLGFLLHGCPEMVPCFRKNNKLEKPTGRSVRRSWNRILYSFCIWNPERIFLFLVILIVSKEESWCRIFKFGVHKAYII